MIVNSEGEGQHVLNHSATLTNRLCQVHTSDFYYGGHCHDSFGTGFLTRSDGLHDSVSQGTSGWIGSNRSPLST